MSKYSEKLKDPQWALFRARALIHHKRECRCCGEDKPARMPLHVHHLRYIQGREPWEYSMEDVMVVCGDCHETIHDNENKWRILSRMLPPWVAAEFETAADMLLKLDPSELAYIGAKLRGLAKHHYYNHVLTSIGYEDQDD
jgi:hypothetical protein